MIRGGTGADSRAMGRVYCEAWKAAYDGILPGGFLDSLTPETAAPPPDRVNPENSLVYEENGVVVGLVNFGESRDEETAGMAEIRSIYVLPGAWKKGVGRELFEAAAEKLHSAGYEKMFLWVLSDNSRARGFYERMGMTACCERKINIAGAELGETRYEMNI